MPTHIRIAAFSLFVPVLFLLLPVTGSMAAQPWPTTEFEVFVGGNTDSSNALVAGALRDLDDYVDVDLRSALSQPVSQATISEMESYLGEVARELQRQGFKPPVLEPIVTRSDGIKAYRVYLLDLKDTPDNEFPPAMYSTDCETKKRPVILINALKALKAPKKGATPGKTDKEPPPKVIGTLPDKTYQDLPHELFHAIQKNYAVVRDNCHLGDWIVEGTAQAVGADMAAWSTRKKNFPNRIKTWMRDRWGRRAYDTNLWIPDDDDTARAGFYEKDDAYGASSFWRYLGEQSATSGAAGTRIVEPDYRYLHDFLDTPLPGQPGVTTELLWLESLLRSHPKFRVGLSRMYPNFINTFASYVPDRFQPNGFTHSVAQDGWLNVLFPMDKCPVLALGGANTGYRDKLVISANAATCFRLELDYGKPVDLHIEVSGASQEQLQALSVGTAAGQIVAKPWIKSAAGVVSASWVIHISEPAAPGEPQPLLVFSNVAQAPESTQLIRATLEIVPAAFSHNMLPAPAKKPARKTAATPTGKPAGPNRSADSVTASSQADRVGAELDAGFDDMNPNLVNSGSLATHPDAKPCKEPFVSSACGPSTSIRLETVPGMFGSVVQSTGRGGGFGQVLSMLSGIAAVGPQKAAQRYENALKRSQQYDAASVLITIPLVDYGFQGSFENASIRVSKRGGGFYDAIGPNDIKPGDGVVFPLAGKVTIEEFSTAVMRGTFEANLVDLDQQTNQSADPSLHIAHQISGRFQIAAPWLDDGRVAREGAEDVVTAVTADVAAAMPGTNIDIQEWADSMTQGRTDVATGNATGNSVEGRLPGCYCSCNLPNNTTQECQDYCQPTVAACTGKVATSDTLAALAFKPVRIDKAAVLANAQPFLLNLPDAQTLLGTAAAAQLLDAPETSRYNGEWLPSLVSSIAWKAKGNGRHTVSLKMMFQPLDIYDSSKLSPEEFQTAALGFNIMNVKESKQLIGPGKMALLADFGDTTMLYVLTGIYGKAWESESFGSELLLTWELANADLPPLERALRLLGTAGPVVDTLMEFATTTH